MAEGGRDGLTPTAIRATDLGRRFGSVTAVDRLSFEVRAGETFGLLGHNGAGKTTTIRLLNGVLGRDAGEAEVLGMDPAVDGVGVRSRTGVLTETPSLDERLSATENLAFFGGLYGVAGGRLNDRVAALLEAFGLAERGKDHVGGFSRGMKQRLALARTLLHDPDILFHGRSAASGSLCRPDGVRV